MRTSTSWKPFFSSTRRDAGFAACGTEAMPAMLG
jgi:hypothetical protein